MKTHSSNSTTNEFNQEVKGNSLGRDAWNRLKKNKMAVISVGIVIIYILLAVSAPILPIYPYDEIILDHQNLSPSLSQTAGVLMRDRKLADLYTQAWRQGRLLVSEQEDEMIETWIDRNKITKVWAYLLAEGNRQFEAGTFTFNASEQRTMDNIDKKIASDIQITVKKVGYLDPSTQQITPLKKLNLEQLVSFYSQLTEIPAELIVEQYETEVEQALLKQIKAESSDLSNEDAELLLQRQLDTMSQRRYETRAKQNLHGKIINSVKNSALSELKSDASQATTTYPLNKVLTVNKVASAKIEASKMHDRRYYLGTDPLGRDLLSRIIYGGQVSIAIGFVGTLTSVLIGVALGALAGYVGGKVDYFIMRIVDIMYGLPYMLLVIIAMAIFGRNILNLFFALAIISWLTISRMVRGQIMSLKNQEFVEAARSMGASTGRIIARHLVPNSLSVIIVYSTLRIPSFIMTESFLSFLGLGVQAPYASWGSLVGEAVPGMTLYPWRLFFPAIAMTIFLFSMNFLGDGLRDAFDPQSKNKL